MPRSGATLHIVNPSTGDVDRHARRRRRRATSTARSPPRKSVRRRRVARPADPRSARACLNRFADLFEADLEAFYKLETLNNGRPITETRAQISRLPQFYRYFAALALTRRSDVIPVEGRYLCYTQRVPLGVVRADDFVQSSADDSVEEPGAGARDRQQRRHQAVGTDAADHRAPRRTACSRPACPTASSTSSTARAAIAGAALAAHPK